MSTGTVILNCARIAQPSLAAVDYIARLNLDLKRSGRRLCLAQPSSELVELIRLLGLAETLDVEVERQPEEREQPIRLEEEGELRDLTAGQLEDLERPG